MGTTAQKLERLIETKNGLREIITAKGVPVSENDTFNSYIDKIAAIKSDLAEVSITANGTYRASDHGVDGFSAVTVDVETGGGGGGGGASLGSKTITENGNYNASEDGLDGYYSVNVDVPNTGTLIDKTITGVGTFNPADDGADGYSSVTVDIDPESMAAPTDKFTVNFYIGDTLSLRVPDIPYGGMAEYPNAYLINDNYNKGYFYGWDPVPNNVRRNMNCYARFSQAARPIQVNEIYEPWEDIIAADKGLNVPLGAYRYLHLGTVDNVTYGSIRMQKVYEGESGSTSTWLAMDPLSVTGAYRSPGEGSYWTNSDLRTWLNDTVFTNVFPEILKNNIQAVTKFSSGIGGLNNQTFDKLWVPSLREICKPTDNMYGKKETYGPEYYNETYLNSYSISTSGRYWLRTSDSNDPGVANNIYYIWNDSEKIETTYSNGSYGGWPQFRIGFCL